MTPQAVTILDCRLYFYSLPLRDRLVMGDRSMEERNGWLLHLILDNGITAWGEAAPLPGISREKPHTLGHELCALRDALQGRLFGDDLLEPDALPPLSPSTRCAFEMAFWNAGYRAGQPSRLPYTQPRVAELELSGLLWGTDENVLDRAEALARSGFEVIKFKVGRRSLDADTALIRRAALAFGRDVRWRFDANRAWNYDEAVFFADAVNGLNVEYIEEPLKEVHRLSEWSLETGMPVALDESLAKQEPGALLDREAIRAVVLKPMLLGGFLRCIEYMNIAERIGAYSVISSLLESGIGIRSLAHFAACSPAGRHAAGLDTYSMLGRDVLCDRLPIQGCRLNVEQMICHDTAIHWNHVREIENGNSQMPFA